MVLIAGCRSAEKATTATAIAPSGKEYQTVEFVQHSEADVRERLVQWQREGWALHSLVTVRQMEDGAKLREAELSRSGSSPEDRKTVQFVERTPTDLKEHMAQWAREGWLVRNVRRIPQADGTVLFGAELARSQSPTAQP